ncbi:MAG: putative fluoride ion transporter CrcB [Pseudomonadales bacterium]|nr:putative fluoride ion transporter CrcB [Pseudomonadales bacterium]
MTDLLRNLFFVAIGGALGALARFGAAQWLHALHPARFPLATLAINASGSFLIGIAWVAIAERGVLHADWRSILMVGFLGSYTTFSTFSLETVTLLEHGYATQAIANVLLSVLVCVGGAWAGIGVARLLWSA